ncbi:MAG: sugar-binding domain-containing protein [Paraglaciecola sp.]|uniref:sugar-binding domain-containing protein n=1 Tax=Paraglaciecola sp. TaxID=1920173 RepID=UPI0032968F19
MKKWSLIIMLWGCLCSHVCASTQARQTIDFNFDWKFHLGQAEGAFIPDNAGGVVWKEIRLPHDWSVDLPYTQQNGASSTGFKPGGIGWYKKSFELTKSELEKAMWFEFDGIYNNAEVWINGHFAAERPNGYSSFAVDLSPFAIVGNNVLTVKVNRSAYNDARWYTGSGIYRDVRLVKTNKNHVARWGVKVLTPKVSASKANISISTELVLSEISSINRAPLYLDVHIVDPNGKEVAESSVKLKQRHSTRINSEFLLRLPQLWSLEEPALYTAKVSLRGMGEVYDTTQTRFGIRSIEFDANRGFLLNGKSTEFKGVNLHHDAGAVGAAVPKEIWRYRLEKLQSVGVNALRLAHNPHATSLLDLADEMGFLVIAEMFDDWLRPKDKSVVFLSDNAGQGNAVKSYTEHFPQWAERDLTDLIRRDFNHPSIIMWSIGNEIEWTYPYYNASQQWDDTEKNYHGKRPPVYDPARVRKEFNKNNGENVDHLVRTAQYLSNVVKKLDLSRPVTAGMVTPSVNFVSGYTDVLDVAGFNYRSQEYDAAHAMYPDKPIYGSENWGTWPEWKAAKDREFVPGIFIWTGFAYKGEAGPWPRKGLEISLFDYAGNKTPRGHQFEGFWVDEPKVYLATIDAAESEYQFDEQHGWVFNERAHPIEKMQWLRAWEWYDVKNSWNYQLQQEVIVHVYSNTEQSELFLNGMSLGKQSISDDNNRILFWQIPFEAGELKVVGYNNGQPVAEYALQTHQSIASIELTSSKTQMQADQYDVAHVHVSLVDKNGNTVLNHDDSVRFRVTGPGHLLAVDNGSQLSVQDERSDQIFPHQGRALAIIQSTAEPGEITLRVHTSGAKPTSISLTSRK